MTERIQRYDKRLTKVTVIVAVVLVALILQMLGANPAVSQAPVLTAFRVDDGPHLDPSATSWDDAPAVAMSLTSQQLTWPFGGSVSLMEAQALHSEGVLYIRMSWNDSTRDDEILHVDQFADAAAVEFPARAASSVPSICMGQTDGGVNIWQWRAANQTGLAQSITDLNPNGYVDRYPSTEGLYFPAREIGNPVALSLPVQDLVSVGFGTLTPAADQDVRGAAQWEDGRWSVVFARELSDPATEHVSFGEGVSADIAFAVWNGSEGERNGIKSVSTFVVLDVVGGGAPLSTGSWLAVVFGSVVGVVALILLPAFALDHSVRRRRSAALNDNVTESP